jgi:hypothetical protein
VALALQIYATRYWVRALGWLYALGTAIVIVGTGNHWVIDAIVGWAVILVGWALAEAIGRIPLHRLWQRHSAPGRTVSEPTEPEAAPVVE